MPSVSNVAIGALQAGAAAHKARHGMNEAISRLSTGMRTVYGGDAGGQSMANSLLAKSKGYAAAGRNIEDGISFAQTAESALIEVGALAQRLFELGIQAGNDELHSSDDTGAQNAEATAIADAIDAIAQKTKFNGFAVLAHTTGTDVTYDVAYSDAADKHTIVSSALDTTQAATLATAAVGHLFATTLLAQVAEALGDIAASLSALKGHQGVALATAGNLAASGARIQDVDFAYESANLTKNSILNQSAMAMVAQANQAQSAVLSVLQ